MRPPIVGASWTASRAGSCQPGQRATGEADPTADPNNGNGSRSVLRRLVAEIDALDKAIYEAVATTPTKTLDKPLTRLSNAATYSRLWLAIAAVLALNGGERGRRTAIRGLIVIVTSSLSADLAAKTIFPRRRPTRTDTTHGRETRMPKSSSFPSGHAATAFAFATVVSADFPRLEVLLYALATGVGWSRIQLGVHYPSDVLGGAIFGLALGTAARNGAPARPAGTT